MGDLLVSSAIQSRPLPHLPTIGDINPDILSAANRFPMKLTRKVCHFGNLALAWSGPYMEAKELIGHLYAEIQARGSISFKDMDAQFSHLSPDVQEALAEGKLALLGYWQDPQSNSSIGFGANYSSIESSTVSDLRIAGSGTNTVIEYFEHQSELEFDSLSDREVGSFELAVCTSLSIAGMLLQLEIGTHESIRSHFGGGYEVIALKDNRFVRCEDLMYAFWYAESHEKGVSLTPVMKFLKQSYVQDILLIRTLEMKSPDPSNPSFLTSREDEIHILPPLYRPERYPEGTRFPKPDLKAFMLCSYILVRRGDRFEVLTKFDWSKHRELPLRFSDNGEILTVELRPRYLQDILASIESRE